MAAGAKKIYVQIDIRCSVDRLWSLTQTPELHEQWDLRFTEIRYLPRPDPDQPQRFLYSTRIGFGLNICGEGESVGSTDDTKGERASALRFWSIDPKSLIRDGSGYWKYIPYDNEQAVRFLTLYGYEVRFAACGRLVDRAVFRPLMSWATAWSFDRLRLWIELGIDPAASFRHSLAHLVARLSLAAVWIYQGLVPKLIFRQPGELAMLRAGGLSDSLARNVCVGMGIVEVAIGLLLIVAWRSRFPVWLTLFAMPLALIAVAIRSPNVLAAPFNAVSLNLSVFALAAVCLLVGRDLPSSRRCVRQPPQGE
jgi:uncharacterized membrane protein YphA (DoxX/SURF4 family)